MSTRRPRRQSRAAWEVSCDDGSDGDEVWIQQRVRDPLNGCTHDRSVNRVNQKIDGKGLPAVCR